MKSNITKDRRRLHNSSENSGIERGATVKKKLQLSGVRGTIAFPTAEGVTGAAHGLGEEVGRLQERVVLELGRKALVGTVWAKKTSPGRDTAWASALAPRGGGGRKVSWFAWHIQREGLSRGGD